MTAINTPRCKDCRAEGVTTLRPAPYPGPRCKTHHLAVTKARRLAAHGKRVEANFGITPLEYWAIYQHQGGVCFICRHATGKTKRLAVDHDHRLAAEHGHDPAMGCQRCVRALLCGPCNQTVGRLGIEALSRAIEVLANPPARKWLVGA